MVEEIRPALHSSRPSISRRRHSSLRLGPSSRGSCNREDSAFRRSGNMFAPRSIMCRQESLDDMRGGSNSLRGSAGPRSARCCLRMREERTPPASHPGASSRAPSRASADRKDGNKRVRGSRFEASLDKILARLLGRETRCVLHRRGEICDISRDETLGSKYAFIRATSFSRSISTTTYLGRFGRRETKPETDPAEAGQDRYEASSCDGAKGRPNGRGGCTVSYCGLLSPVASARSWSRFSFPQRCRNCTAGHRPMARCAPAT